MIKKKHPKDMSKDDIESFLSYLATDCRVSPSTQNQAFNALLFLYEQAFDISLEGLEINL